MSAGGYKLLVADPERLSLPALAPGEEIKQVGPRSVTKVADDLPGMGRASAGERTRTLCISPC